MPAFNLPIVLVSLFAPFILIASISQVKAENLVNIGILDYPPFVIKNTNGKLSGVSIEIINKTFKHADIKTKFELLPFSRAIMFTENGTNHAIGMVNRKTSTDIALSEVHYLSLLQTFFTRQDNPWYYTGIDSLNSQKILNIQDYDYSEASEEYQQYLRNKPNVINLVANEGYLERAAHMLIFGRADVFNEGRLAMKFAIQKAGLSNHIVEAGALSNGLNLYIGFAKSKEGDKFRKVYDISFQALLKSGKIKEILRKHDAYRESN